MKREKEASYENKWGLRRERRHPKPHGRPAENVTVPQTGDYKSPSKSCKRRNHRSERTSELKVLLESEATSSGLHPLLLWTRAHSHPAALDPQSILPPSARAVCAKLFESMRRCEEAKKRRADCRAAVELAVDSADSLCVSRRILAVV